jgi:capsular exopolysaccharide synthesis family protein
MSRIFDALQRSSLEGEGFEFPLVSSLATEMAQTAAEEEIGKFVTTDLEHFQSLPISVSSESRMVCLTDQASLGAEKFRFLAVRLRQLQLARAQLKKVLITSTIPEEGKSMVAANLAISLAHRRQQKILLVEGDLRRPSLSTRFGLQQLPGLSEWLRGNRDPITNLYRLEQASLWFLPAGELLENPLELMQSGRLSVLMDQLTTCFDWILIDSPPVLPLADTSVWSRFADGVLLVARERTSRLRELKRGLRALEPSHLLGVVLNSCAPTDENNYYQRYRPVGDVVKG